MNEEVTKKDVTLSNLSKKPKLYGRGSRVRLKHSAPDLTYQLVCCKGNYWTVLNPHDMLESVHQDQIEKIIFNGRWFNFDSGSREWKKSP